MTTLLGLAWALRTAAAVLGAVSFWQVKEYRLDRARAHLALASARRQLLHPLGLGKWILLAALVLSPSLRAAGGARALVLLLFSGEAILVLVRFFRASLPRPHPTLRAFAASAVSFAAVTLGVLWALGRFELPLTVTLLAADRLTGLAVAAGVALTAPVAAAGRTHTIRRATARMRALPLLTTIGITGSYGKSSTKEFLSTLLEGRFRVAKTPANVNTEVGVAQTILTTLREDHRLFVCEMGAYRPGEIARLTEMTRPRIGILTAARGQHLGLFGSTEALVHAKGELLRALPADGIAIINGDDPNCIAAARGIRARRVLRFGRGYGNEVRATAVRPEHEHLTVEVQIGREQATFTTSLLGTGAVSSTLAAVTAAHALGLSLGEIQERMKSLRPLPRTMEPRRNPRGTLVIDDTYSANPDGVIAAVENLPAMGRDRAVVVLTTMIELGSAARTAHRRVGEALARVRPDLTVITSRDYAADIVAGACTARTATPTIVIESQADRARRLVEPLLGSRTVLLLEGRIPERLRQTFLRS